MSSPCCRPHPQALPRQSDGHSTTVHTRSEPRQYYTSEDLPQILRGVRLAMRPICFPPHFLNDCSLRQTQICIHFVQREDVKSLVVLCRLLCLLSAWLREGRSISWPLRYFQGACSEKFERVRYFFSIFISSALATVVSAQFSLLA